MNAQPSISPSAPPPGAQTLANSFDSGDISPDLRRKYTEHGILPLWEADDSLLRGGPTEAGKVWHWEDLKPIVEETSTILTPSVVERRVLQLRNPNIRGPAAASTGLITVALQSIQPGESARPHRHTMNALRFILDGSGGETVVDGKPCLMTPGDLILTPGWAWHGHRNTGSQHTIWLDILDLPLHVGLGTVKFQPGPDRETFATFEDANFGVAGMVPVMPGSEGLPHSPRFRYPWSDVLSALAVTPPAADGSKSVRYVNPMTGGAVMSLIDCFAIELAEGQETIPMRSSAHTICSVVEGRGETRIDGVKQETLAWSAKDVFTLPQHSWVSYKAVGDRARLFTASNREAFRRLGLLVEERQVKASLAPSPETPVMDFKGHAL